MQEVCLKNAPENPQSSRGHTTIKVWYANLKQKTLVLLDRSAEEHILRRLSFSVPGHLIITLHQLIDVTAQGAWKVWVIRGDKGYLKITGPKRDAMVLMWYYNILQLQHQNID